MLVVPVKKETPWRYTWFMSMKQNHMQVITRKARIKYVALLNVLFYKWLGYPAGISGWHCAAVTTTISPTHACLSMGASPQKSNVRCYPSPLIESSIGGSEALLLSWGRKNTITGLLLLCGAVDVNCLLILCLTEGGRSSNYHTGFSCEAKFSFHTQSRKWFIGSNYIQKSVVDAEQSWFKTQIQWIMHNNAIWGEIGW